MIDTIRLKNGDYMDILVRYDGEEDCFYIGGNDGSDIILMVDSLDEFIEAFEQFRREWEEESK